MKPIPELSEADLKRFWSKVDQSGDCWLWKGTFQTNGYGKFSIGGRSGSEYIATRVMFTLEHYDPGELHVCHTCDVPACVNPEHLWLGTQKDNLQDASEKQKIAYGKRHGMSVLSEEDAQKILISKIPGNVLAEKYGVSQECVSTIKAGRSWAHLDGQRRKPGSANANSTTGIRGVSFCKQTGRYKARTGKHWLGRFDTIDEAAIAIKMEKTDLLVP